MPLAELGRAMAAESQRLGGNPLFELETGRMTEADSWAASAPSSPVSSAARSAWPGSGSATSPTTPNAPMIAFMRELRARGLRLAICTNNVREWEQRWRAMVPVPEVFEVVVDSAHVGMRKPEPGIYELTLERLGVAAGDALFVDDIEINCDGGPGARHAYGLVSQHRTGDRRHRGRPGGAGLTVRRWLGAGAVLAAAIVVLIIAVAGAGTPGRGRVPRSATATVTAQPAAVLRAAGRRSVSDPAGHRARRCGGGSSASP